LTEPVDHTALPSVQAALNTLQLVRRLARIQTFDFYPGLHVGGYVAAGTGGISGGTTGDAYVRLQTGATSASTEAIYYQAQQQFAQDGVTGNGSIDYSQQISVTWRFSCFAELTTNAFFRASIGKNNGAGVLNASGFGFEVTYKSSGIGSLKLQTHDGSLHTSAELSEITTSADGPVHEVTIETDGTGNAYLYLNGVYKGTAATAPATNAAATRYLVAEVGNGADSSNNMVYLTMTRGIVKKN
jgi:hypothetical protein